jgi:hypothetical protein
VSTGSSDRDGAPSAASSQPNPPTPSTPARVSSTGGQPPQPARPTPTPAGPTGAPGGSAAAGSGVATSGAGAAGGGQPPARATGAPAGRPAPSRTVTVPPALEKHNRTAGPAIGVAMAAIVLALLATAVAAVALFRANDAQSRADRALAGVPSADSGNRPVGPSGPSGGATPIQTSTPNPGAAFVPVYLAESLKLQASECGFVGVDLDRPQVAAGEFELRFRGPCADNVVRLETLVVASVASSSDVTPEECTDLIRRAPLGVSQVTVSKGLVLCLRTSADEAQRQGIPQKLAVLEVVSVADDGTTEVRVTAWSVPR